jgi:hypothetical protein
MDKCERLQALLDEAIAEGNEHLADALRNAMAKAGCGASADFEDDGGGNGNGPPP